ncbi:MAG: glycoside hydrolase family 3 C-terminal domain-containing protein [Oscillospiraceae bacterium]|nr:glycoside hydrolase family 3 C-terminal domain-containing protein [Oscillospiraceae bacterium]
MYPFQDTGLSPRERVADLLGRLTIEEKIAFLSTHNMPVERLGIGEWFVGTEIARGLVNREPDRPTTVFPQPLGMAASFDKEMMYRIGLTAGKEARAYYNQRNDNGLMVWGPTVDLSRDPRWGRTEECYGEDPCLAGEMSAMYTNGLRGEEQVWATIPTLKHFCANNHEQERNVDNANLHPRIRHEYYYTAFRTPVMYGGAHSVMTAYNDICHAPAVMNHDLKNVLKKDWGLGFVVTDGGDFVQNLTAHKLFDSHAKALQACLRAGADTMTDNADCVMAAATKALAEGLLNEEDVDLAVGNLLESLVLLGHFDAETPYDKLTLDDVNTPEDRALNLQAAREGMVLLTNDNGALPLDPGKHKKIGLFGQNADCILKDWYTGYWPYQVTVKDALEERGCEVVYDLGWDIVILGAPNGQYLCIGEDDCLYADADARNAARFYLCKHDDKGRWTNFRHVESGRFLCIDDNCLKLGHTEVYGWFTSETFSVKKCQFCADTENPDIISDYLHGNQLTLGKENRVILRPKARPDASVRFCICVVDDGWERLGALAKTCDAVVYCGGNDPEQTARECFDRETILLPEVQMQHVWDIADDLHGTGIPLIFAIVSSYPYALGELTDKPDAILWTSHAGPEMGHALAETLFGENVPAGRLPVTWYASDDDLADIHDYDIVRTKMTYLYFDGTPLFPFGYGLSYTSFGYDAFRAEATAEGIAVSATITNTGSVDADEVVQVYAHAQFETMQRPQQWLVGFQRLHIPAGESVQFSAVIPLRNLAIYDVSRQRFCVEAGQYELRLGASSADIRCTLTVDVPGETIPPRDLTTETPAEFWDAQYQTEIFTDALSGETHVRGLAWDNDLYFRNCDLTGVQELVIRAAAPVDPATVKVLVDDAIVGEAVVPVGDGFTDFREVRVPLHADGCHTLRLHFPQLCCIRSIRAVK